MPNLQAMRYPIILSILFLFLLSSCRKIQDPVFNSIENIRVGKLGFGTSLMTFDVHYFNPNNSRASMKEAEGEAWLDSNYIGHFHVDTMVSIPARSNFTVPVKLDVDMKYLLMYSLSGLKNEEVLVTVKGKAKVGKAGIYKNIAINYEGNQNLAQLVK